MPVACHDGSMAQEIAHMKPASSRAVAVTVRRALMAKLSWPLPCYLDDPGLESLLYPPPNYPLSVSRPQPDWNSLNNELITHKNLTLMLLWQEYKERAPEGYQYSQYWFGSGARNWISPCARRFPIGPVPTYAPSPSWGCQGV